MSIGSTGSDNNQLNNPEGIVYDSRDCTLYIADTNNHRLLCYLKGPSADAVVPSNNGAEMDVTRLFSPMGLYFDSLSNSLLIASRDAQNIVRWEIGANSWALVASNMDGSSSNTSTELYQSRDVTLDPIGNVYVADTFNHRIQFFLAGQSNGITIAGITGRIGINATLFYYPGRVIVDT